MPEKLQTFLVSVSIIEGRHYAWSNMNSIVLTKIDNHKKFTAVKQSTDCPYYNEYFVFEFFTSLDKMMDKNITLQVIKPGSCIRKQKVLGYITFDVGTVWFQKNHQFYHKWAILSAPHEEVVGGNRGYLKIDVAVLFKGEAHVIPPETNTDEIEGNLLLPEGVTLERERVVFYFDIYRGENFIKKNLTSEACAKKALENPPTSVIEVSFAGLKTKSTVKKHTSSPIWNERLSLPELFPPLCQRFIVELHQGSILTRDPTALRYLNMRDVANDKEEGFLPTFGPNFFHFYSPNPLEGYLGTIIFSLTTELLTNVLEIETNKTATVLLQDAPAINENLLFRHENVTLFATIFEVNAINKRFADKLISFRLACGPLTKDTFQADALNCSFCTPALKPISINKNLCYLPIAENKPCMHLIMSLPDLRKRMYNHNLLTKFATELKSRLEKIENVFETNYYKTSHDQMDEMLLDALDFSLSASQKYIDIASSYDFENDSELDQNRLTISLKEMNKIKDILTTVYHNVSRRKIFRKLEKICTNIDALIGEIEDWPTIYLWMVYGNKRVAYYKIDPKTVLYSKVEEERGINCGYLQTIFLQIPGEELTGKVDFISMACKVRVALWMGISRHWDDYMNNLLPQGFTPSPGLIPHNLEANQKYHFLFRAHIFQGRFSPGSDKSGLCDPFAVVLTRTQYRQTQVLKNTLNPVWDQTLIFNKVILFGTKRFIVENPPTFFVEICDRDECNKLELVGRSAIKPVIKVMEEPYHPPKFPPKLFWFKAYNKFDVAAEYLAAFELIENSPESEAIDENKILRIPAEIKPNLVNYRIEVLFWGVRNLKKVQLMQINKAKITVECLNQSLTSDTLSSGKKNLNFTNPIKSFDVTFPEQEEYAPPLSLKMFDCRNFGINVFAGTHILPISHFLYYPQTDRERDRKLQEGRIMSFYESISLDSILTTIQADITKSRLSITSGGNKSIKKSEKKVEKFSLKQIYRKLCSKGKVTKEVHVDEKSVVSLDEAQWVESDEFDWWTKFYASLAVPPVSPDGKIPLQFRHRLEIYPNELELQPEFSNFSDTLQTFPMYKGKRTGDESVDEINTVGVFKGSIKIYRWPPPRDSFVTASGEPLEKGVFQDFPVNTAVRFVVRIYCVRALNVRPQDSNGKSDCYLYLTLNQQVINDKGNCVMHSVNPVFGKCYEFSGMFPEDHTLSITLYDWDLASADDLIGETKIDLESRFYSKYRAYCGIPEHYETSGYCKWRDQQRPVSILDGLCRKYNLPEPEYGATSVKVAYNEFQPKDFSRSGNEDLDRQVLALAALRRWAEVPVVGFKLVPEHVETRSLYHPNKPGIEQGKIQLWVDVIPSLDLPPPKQVNISPRKPVSYQLRVIIWNTDNIKLDEDDFFTGEKKSDIFVKGWLASPEDAQFTDVHYRSLSGEGNFNWRFIFPFEYLSTENKIVTREKEGLTTLYDTEFKIPCKLNLQVWDNDTFSANDFLGCVSLELTKLPRGAKTSKNCHLSILEPNAPVVNLFKIRRTRGWWPFTNTSVKTGITFAGSVEAEFELISEEDAKKSPAGVGRDEPQALPAPKRPDVSFSWFRNPWKAFCYVLKLHRWKMVKVFVIAALLSFGAAMYYALPTYSVKKLLHV